MSKSFKTAPAATASRTAAASTTFVDRPLNLEKRTDANPNVERKRMQASEAATDFVSMVKVLSRGDPPSNQQMGHAIKMSQDVLHRETENPHLDSKAKTLLYHVNELLDTFEAILVKKNKDEVFQKFWLSSMRTGKELRERGENTNWSKTVDTYKVESLADDLVSVMRLAVREPSFRRLIVEMIEIMESMVSIKAADVKEDVIKGKGLTTTPTTTSTRRSQNIIPAVLGERKDGSTKATLYAYDDELHSKEIQGRGGESNVEKDQAIQRAKSAAGQVSGSLHNMLLSLSRNKEWQRGMRSIFSIVDYLQASLDTTGFKANRLSNNMVQTFEYAKEIIESFMKTKTLDPIIAHVKRLVLFIQGDQRLKSYIASVRDLVERSMTDREFIKSEGYKTKANKIMEEGKSLGNDYYEELQIKKLAQEAREIVYEITHDHELMSLSNSMKNITNSCVRLDSRGKQVLDANTLGQMREVIAPLLIEQLAYIPIPHIQHRSKSLDWDVDGLVFSAYDVLPEHVFFDTNTRTDFKPLTEYQKSLITDIIESGRHESEAVTAAGRERVARNKDPNEFQQRFNGYFTITLTNIRASFKDVRFAFQRKAFPKLKDEGLADVSIAGKKGCNITIRVEMDNRNLQHAFFTGGSATVKVSKLKVALRKTRRDGFYNVFLKLFSGAIASQIETAIAERIAEVMSTVIEKMNQISRKAPGRLTSGSSIVSYLRNQIMSG